MITTMRQQMVATIEELFQRDKCLSLVLGDISLELFANVFQRYPERAFNLGIMEQTMVSVAAGLALEGFIPIVHSITPFLVERPFEQIKDDFCYQHLGGNFISTGASYDYGTDGMTHHGSADVPILKQLPGMQIVVPGTPKEFDQLFQAAYANGAPTYYRMSMRNNPIEADVQFGKLAALKEGKRATVIAVGSALAHTLPAVSDLDVSLYYCTTVAPFDKEALLTSQSSNIILVEPYYEGALVADIAAALRHRATRIEAIGVPHKVLSHYGSADEHDAANGLSPHAIRQRIEQFLI